MSWERERDVFSDSVTLQGGMKGQPPLWSGDGQVGGSRRF